MIGIQVKRENKRGILGLPVPPTTPMPPNPRPGENPADIVDGARKRKASERSILANDPAAVGPKKAKTTMATGKKKPVTKKTTTTVVKSTVFLKESC